MNKKTKIIEIVSYAFTKGGWPALSVFAVHVFISTGLNAYSLYPALDIPMHFLGGLAICYFFWVAAKAPHSEILLGSHNRTSLFIMLLTLTGTVTIFWEFLEWLTDKLFLQQTQVSINDTMGDMLLGLMGSLTLCLWVSFKR